MKRQPISICFFTLAVMLACSLILHAQPKHPRGIDPMDRMDRNRDGMLSKQEFRGPTRVFTDMDTDNNGYVTREEMRAFHQKRNGRKRMFLEKTDEGPYPDLIVKKYDKSKAWPGNVIFVDKNRNRVVEINLHGNVVWECNGPDVEVNSRMRRFCGSRLTDVELLPNDHVLVLVGGAGVYELDRNGKIVWSYENKTVSHDADRLDTGNTLMACVGAEKASAFPYKDPQAIEVNPKGEIVWAWYAKKEYANSKYRNIRSKDANDWTHMNSVQRLADGNTLLSVRNWNLIIAVDKEGHTVWETGKTGKIGPRGWPLGEPNCPHTPVMLNNGNIIVSESIKGRVLEWDRRQGRAVWMYPAISSLESGVWYFTRASHRLPNGNTFIIDSLGQFLEVTPDREIVWHAQLADYEAMRPGIDKNIPHKSPCFNADRRGLPYYGGR